LKDSFPSSTTNHPQTGNGRRESAGRFRVDPQADTSPVARHGDAITNKYINI